MITGKYFQKVWKIVLRKCPEWKNKTNPIGEEKIENKLKRYKIQK